MANFFTNLKKDNKEFDHVPSRDDIVKAMTDKTSVTAISNDNDRNTITFYGDKNIIIEDYLGGQISFETSFDEYDINPSDVRYIVTENFLCPAKACSSVTRFYTLPYKTQSEAEKALEELELHDSEKFGKSIKELVIIDCNKLLESEWYAKNLIAIKFTQAIQKFNQEHPEYETEIPFEIFVSTHMKLLMETHDKQHYNYINGIYKSKTAHLS